jgi:hypothetical protein
MIKKNADREWYKKFRVTWDRSPITHIKPSKKVYSRSKELQEVKRGNYGE